MKRCNLSHREIRRIKELCTYRGAILEISSSSVIEGDGCLHIGKDHVGKGKQETYLKMGEASFLNVRNEFKMMYGSTIQIYKGGHLSLGKSYMNSNSIIFCKKKIVIGDGVMIARGVKIYDTDFHTIFGDNGEQINTDADVIIEDHVWIGLNAIILKGVTIGEGSIVAAGSVVTKNVPAHCMVAGNPARKVKEHVMWR